MKARHGRKALAGFLFVNCRRMPPLFGELPSEPTFEAPGNPAVGAGSFLRLLPPCNATRESKGRLYARR
jgi:hypothetical protein